MTRAEIEAQAEWLAGADLDDGRDDTCDYCEGDGIDPMDDDAICPVCDGEG